MWKNAVNCQMLTCRKRVSSSQRTLKNSFVQGRHICGYCRRIIFISDLDYFISFHDCFLCAFQFHGCLLALHWSKIYSPGWNWVCLEATASRKPAEAQWRQHLLPRSAPSRPEAVSQERKIRWVEKGCNLHLHYAGIMFSETPEHRGSHPGGGRGVPLPWIIGA